MGVLKDSADSIYNSYWGWHSSLSNACARLDSAGAYLKLITPDFYWAGVDLQAAAEDLAETKTDIYSIRSQTKLFLYYIEDNYSVTWKSICEAWLKDDFEGRAATIAIIDRMRQILWDEPFNIIWAARPEDKKL
ncbi:hypothetical protein ES703_88316 [subsurface metagenome]